MNGPGGAASLIEGGGPSRGTDVKGVGGLVFGSGGGAGLGLAWATGSLTVAGSQGHRREVGDLSLLGQVPRAGVGSHGCQDVFSLMSNCRKSFYLLFGTGMKGPDFVVLKVGRTRVCRDGV